MLKKGILTLFLTQFLFISVYSQLNNSFFDMDKYDQKIDSSHWQFHLDHFSYFRNTEYTSLVDKGSTFVGMHYLPYVQYSFGDKAQLFAGLFLRYDFGNPQVKTFQPYFKFVYELWGHDLIFGNLEGTVQHRLIEPLFDYEYAITDRPEHGIQIKKAGKVFDYDFWIDWQRMIYQDDPFNEEFFGGLNLYINPINSDKNKLSLNSQTITVHHAGEIDLSANPNTMEYNMAFGLEYTHFFNEETDLFISGHSAYYEDFSRPPATGFKDGLGQFGVLRLTHKEYQFVLNYWDAHQFQAPLGDRLYASIGRKNPYNPIDYRKMAGFRIAYEVKLAKQLYFLNRIGVNYNIDHSRADVIMENYLRWHIRSKPKKITLN